ncbi:MAG TPA: aminodeoxychorismate/anthranilate synthase component II [Candidatus Polarisedimenticolia bacterium]|nr:aminodeoxychorismate/anthranilate synthase component II [Candidatus Polarisedimenticolia bacterium]
MIFMLDNYDSFTWNLAQYLMELGAEVTVRRNDETTVQEVMSRSWDGILISPGPGRPEGAGITLALLQAAAGRVPLLGVCLGHQAIGALYGGKVVRAAQLMHGKTSAVEHDGRGVFRGLPSPFEATRYHSLVVERATLPAELEVTATARDGDEEVIMGLRHGRSPVAVEGVQFHPESILTVHGKRLLANFLEGTGRC